MLQIPLWKRVLILAVCAAGILFSFPNGFYGAVERHNDAAVKIDQFGATPEREAALAEWPSFLPSTLINLGLDLRGGAQLLLDVEVEDVYQQRMDVLWPEVRAAMIELRDQVGFVERVDDAPNGVLQFRINNADGMSAALTAVRNLAQPVVSLTGAAGSTLDVAGQGNTITATSELVSVSGGPIALDRSAVRVTVLGSHHAVDIQGCAPAWGTRRCPR